MASSVVRLADPHEVLQVEQDARDRRAAEVRFAAVVKAKPGTPLRTIVEGWPETWGAWIHWHAATRQGLTSEPWDRWSERVVDIDAPDDGAALPDPTGPVT
jgi:hypothetical protein